jgi:Tfp pilus assembly protein PilF
MASATSIGLALQLFIVWDGAQDATPRFVAVALPIVDGPDETVDRRFATPRLGAGGLAIADVDGDGRPDLYVGRAGGLPNRLLLTRDHGKFAEGAHDYGLDVLDATCGALFTDLDGDGRDDVVVFGDALHALRRNGGRFEPDAALGIALPAGFDGVVTAVATADVDGDGDRDLYVATSRAASGRLADLLPYPLFDATNGPRHLFFRNDGGKYVEALEAAGLAPGATRLARDARFLDVDSDGDADLVVANDPGLAQLYLNDGKGHFTEVALCTGRDLVGAARFIAFEDLDGAPGGARELWIAAPSDPAGEERLAEGSAWRDGLARRIQGDALSSVAGGFALACGPGGRKEVSATLGLAHLGPFSCGVVADFAGDAAPEIVLFGREHDDRGKYWSDVVPTHARLGADPKKAAEALAALPPRLSQVEPRLLARAADGAFHVVPAALPDLPTLLDPAAVVAWDFDGDGERDLAVLGAADGALVVLRNVTREPAVNVPPIGPLGPRNRLLVRSAVATPAPGGELPTARGGRVRLDAKRERPVLVVLGEPTEAAAEAAALADVDVVLLGAPSEAEAVTRARTVFERVSKVVTGDRFAARRFRVDRDGWIDLIAAEVPLTELRDVPAAAPGRWLGERRRGVADLPRAVLAAGLPNVAITAWQRLEAAGVTGFDLDVGLAQLETRRSSDAEPRLAAVPPASPDYARAQLELARLCERGKREPDARAAYLRAAAAAPTDGVARFELGRFLLRSTDAESEAAGTEALRFATYLAPEWGEAHFAFGKALVRVNRLEEAADAFARAVTFDRDSAPGHFELASVLHRLHRDVEALGHAKRVLELAPENAAAAGKLLEAVQAAVKD